MNCASGMPFVSPAWKHDGVIDNSERFWDYAWYAKRLVYKWLNRARNPISEFHVSEQFKRPSHLDFHFIADEL